MDINSKQAVAEVVVAGTLATKAPLVCPCAPTRVLESRPAAGKEEPTALRGGGGGEGGRPAPEIGAPPYRRRREQPEDEEARRTMNYIGKFISNFKDFYNEINAATLTGAIDVVVVRQEDATYTSSPFHVRFGKMGVLRSREKVVDIEINGEPVDIHMKLGETGEAFFVEEVQEGDDFNSIIGTSPLPESFLTHLKEEDHKSQDSGVEAEDSLPTVILSMKGEDGPGSTNLEQNKNIVVHVTNNENKTTEDQRLIQKVIRKPQEKKDSETQTEFPEYDMQYLLSNPACAINGKEDPQSMSKSLNGDVGTLKRNSGTALEGQGSKTDGEENVKAGSKNLRRKRKKRGNGKKNRPKSTGSQSSDTSTTSEVPDPHLLLSSSKDNPQDGIFIMEDLETPEKMHASDCSMISNLPHSASEPMDFPNASTVHSHLAQSSSMPLLREKSREDIINEWSGAMSRSMGPDSHPFSDTDISPPPSPSTSRPPTPIKSDTEYEVERQRSEFADVSSQTDLENKWSWTWGELPTPPPKTPTRTTQSKTADMNESTNSIRDSHNGSKNEEDQRSMLGGMFSFMRATKKARHNPESEGIYLDDLNLEELDPEVAALYFPRNFKVPEKSSYSSYPGGAKDEDVESGNGPSLPHSPHSVEGAIGGPKLSDSDYEDSRHPIFDYKGYHDIAFSLCGRLHEHLDCDFPESLFLQSLITYDDFCENPQLIDNPDLVVRLNNKYYNWATAGPVIMSLVLFQRPLPQKLVEDLSKEHMPKKEIRKRTESKGYSWFSWRRNNQAQEEATKEEVKGDAEEPKVENKDEKIERVGGSPEDSNLVEMTVAETQTSPPGTPKKQSKENSVHRGIDSSESEDGTDEEKTKEGQGSGDRYKKSLRLTSDQIAKLNLRDGSNEVVFSVTTAYQGTTRCKCHIFLWNYDDKIVVSDIDGTITKSDVLGHILPIIGKDWAQGGVAQLFTKIKNNGYHFLYLSARAIGQARITRDYLKSIKQGDLSLPDGPLLLNPTSLVQAFHREVIERKPEEFKISCLRDIQALFPSDRNPFYAGYGNRINDVWAYRAVGIPISRIFTINHRGELKHELTQTFQSSYIRQSKVVDDTFPPIDCKMVPRNLLLYMYSDSEGDGDDECDSDSEDGFSAESDIDGFPTGYSSLSDIAHHMFPSLPYQETLGEFSSLQYWRPPMPDVSLEIEALLASERSK
ncbi:phosphatidate phosphatase LPIN isoform X4 [Oratosquilla oratoria]|uniref:phosphatidate phosphatase LPIN isoform X4 n=1 Tax=Oratosquilla oratoria TaxID=337810 RepID=UPI003F76DEF5